MTMPGQWDGHRDQVVIVGFDGSPASVDGLTLAQLLAPALDASLALACVHQRHWRPRAAGSVDPAADARARLASAPLDSETAEIATRRAVPANAAYEGLSQLADELEACLIVVGSTHRGALGRLVPGSVASRLLSDAPCPVAIAPRGFTETCPGEPRVLAAAFDGSPESHAAVDHAVMLADRVAATVRVIAVADRAHSAGTAAYGYMTQMTKADVEETVRRLVAELPPSVRAAGTVFAGNPVSVIVDETGKGVDLLYMGSRGFGPLQSALLGSTSFGVTREIECPIVIVPPTARHSTPRSRVTAGRAQ